LGAFILGVEAMAIDLHLHTTASDGTSSPEELVRHAAELGLKAIAITDHDSVDGIPAALEEGRRQKIEVVPGVELSSDLGGLDVHFLGYFIDYENEWLRGHLEKLRHLRYERALKIVEKLRDSGVKIVFEDVLAEAGEGAVGRAHIARVMVKEGYVSAIGEAFEKHIGRQAPCYVEKYFYTPGDVIRIIKRVGGIPVFAHPGQTCCDEKIPEFIREGVEGLEVYHSEHTAQQVEHYKKMAKENGLIITGGSDCHGLKSLRGFIMGSVFVPGRVLKDLKRFKNLQHPQNA
jgi:predicted metal-dependent phosphoesterase TrpH